LRVRSTTEVAQMDNVPMGMLKEERNV